MLNCGDGRLWCGLVLVIFMHSTCAYIDITSAPIATLHDRMYRTCLVKFYYDICGAVLLLNIDLDSYAVLLIYGGGCGVGIYSVKIAYNRTGGGSD